MISPNDSVYPVPGPTVTANDDYRDNDIQEKWSVWRDAEAQAVKRYAETIRKRDERIVELVNAVLRLLNELDR